MDKRLKGHLGFSDFWDCSVGSGLPRERAGSKSSFLPSTWERDSFALGCPGIWPGCSGPLGGVQNVCARFVLLFGRLTTRRPMTLWSRVRHLPMTRTSLPMVRAQCMCRAGNAPQKF